jgi:hypothetical protein
VVEPDGKPGPYKFIKYKEAFELAAKVCSVVVHATGLSQQQQHADTLWSAVCMPVLHPSTSCWVLQRVQQLPCS